MQHIQDKEFDRLFRDRFEGAEIRPSADLWANISPQLEPKRKYSFSVRRMAAAAVGIAALTAGLIFSTRQNFNNTVPGLKQETEITVVKENPAAVHASANIAVKSDSDRVSAQQNTIAPSQSVINSALPVNLLTAGKSGSSGAIKKTVTIVNPAANSDSADETDNTAELYAKKVLLAMQPLNEITHLDNEALIVKQQMMGLPKSTVKPHEVMMMANLNYSDEDGDRSGKDNEQPDAHKGIRNVGDLVNYVVNKVDKRGEKFLQFKTEDDNSSLIAINIGILKFNKKKRK